MAALSQVVDVLETLYPLRYAEQWDEPGLIVGDLRQPVRNIAFAADPSMAVVDQAIAGGVDLLVCHHPLFFRSVHAVSGLGFRGESCASSIVPDARCGGAYECRCSISWCRHGCG